jgi:hypothetical protein
VAVERVRVRVRVCWMVGGVTGTGKFVGKGSSLQPVFRGLRGLLLGMGGRAFGLGLAAQELAEGGGPPGAREGAQTLGAGRIPGFAAGRLAYLAAAAAALVRARTPVASFR